MKNYRTYIILFFILLISFLLNTWNNNFPLGYHADEFNKVAFVKNHDSYSQYLHPVLMRQAVKFINLIIGLQSAQAIVILGRFMTAIFGVLTVFLTFITTKKINKDANPYLAALLVCVSPILVIHSHYFKEDILLGFCLISFVYFLVAYSENGSSYYLIFTAVFIGLAASSKYVGIIAVFIYLISRIFCPFKKNKIPFFAECLIILAIAYSTFALVNYSHVTKWLYFTKGVSSEWKHAIKGHTIYYNALNDYLLFHFKNSLIPGLTWPIAIIGSLGIILNILRWKLLNNASKILLIYLLIFYFVHELSPLKPYPGYIRYMVPMAPVFSIFAVNFLHKLTAYQFIKKNILLYIILVSVLVLFPFSVTTRLVYHLNKDTRQKTVEYFKKHKNIKPYFTSYANQKSFKQYAGRSTIKNVLKKGYTHIAVSSLEYERYFIGQTRKDQAQYVYGKHRQYADLFEYQYIEIRPSYMTFAFSNPTIRIVDIRKKGNN